MTVRKIVGEKGHTVVTVLAGDLVSKAVETLGTHKIGAVVVSDGADGVAGILSERDIVRWIAKSGASVLERKVGDLMTSDVVTCTLDDTIADLMGIMTRGKFRHLPVVIDGKLYRGRLGGAHRGQGGLDVLAPHRGDEQVGGGVVADRNHARGENLDRNHRSERFTLRDARGITQVFLHHLDFVAPGQVAGFDGGDDRR